MYNYFRDKFLHKIRLSPFFIQFPVLSFINNREHSIWIKSGKPLPPPRIIKEKIISKCQASTGCRILVETGTYRGDMIFFQLNNFDLLYSIELDEQLFNEAKRRFKKYQHVTIVHGDSGKVLRRITDQLKEPAIFWLDGHYSSGVTALGDQSTPILEELKTIFDTKIDHAILIDDARLFGTYGDYPTMERLTEFIHQYYPGLPVEVSDDCIQFVLNN